LLAVSLAILPIRNALEQVSSLPSQLVASTLPAFNPYPALSTRQPNQLEGIGLAGLH
jgi:hypothetical protein